MELQGIPPPGPLHIDITGNQQEQIWREWIETLETYFLAANIVDSKRRKALLLYLGGDQLRIIYKTLGDSAETFKNAKKLLDIHFQGKKNLAFERYKFRQAVQSPEESMKMYVTKLRDLSKHCKFEDYSREDAIIDQVIENCKSSDTRKKLLSEENLTVEKLINLATLKESVDQQASYIEKKESCHTVQEEQTAFQLRRSFQPPNKPQRKSFQSPSSSPQASASSSSSWKLKAQCYGCGETGHIKYDNECPARGIKCNYCNREHHLEKMCQAKNKSRNSNNTYQNQKPKEVKMLQKTANEEYLFSLNPEDKYDVELLVDEIPVKFKIDSGASVIVVPQQVGRELEKSGNLKIHKTDVNIFTYGSNKPMSLEGVIYANISHRDNHILGRIHIASTWNSDCILDRKSAQELGLLKIYNEASLNSLEESSLLPKLVNEFPSVFSGFGKLKNVKIKFNINKEVKPVSQHLRRMPFHVRKKVERKIEELIKLDIIEEVTEATPWVSPVQAVPKGDDVRMCVDMRQANRAIERTHYPVPTLEELLEKFNGHTVYSHLDFNHGYHQIELDEESRKITTFITHCGLYRYKRLVQGASGALEAYQYQIGLLFASHPGIANISDDILIGGKDQEEHDSNLRKCLKILEENGLTVNKEKCEISVSQITFFGHTISAEGIHPEISKVEAIKQFPVPTCRKEISSFLGMINYLARFISGLASETEKLRKLLRQDTPWVWGKEQDDAFQNLKELVSSELVIAHFDIELETSLIVDAGPVGLGAILVQKQKDDTLRPVHFASRTLTAVERRYSQTEREALAVIFGCERFHLYLYGQHFTILTDHQPLTVLYNHSGRPSPRILRWGLRLMSYDFEIKHIAGKVNPADMLSICPMPYSKSAAVECEKTEEYINSLLVYNIPKAVTLSEVIEESQNDRILQEVVDCVQKNIWSSKMIEVQPYKKVMNELAVKSGILFKEERLVIPTSLRKRVLNIAHESHQGIVKTKALLREKVWWPHIDEDVESIIRSCIPCLSVAPDSSPEPMKSHEMTGPWEKVHVDLCGPFPTGESILGIIDANSRWPDIHIMKSTTSDKIVDCLDKTFTTHGYPGIVVTDNAPNLTSVHCEEYCEINGITHQKSIPYWPQGNAEVERFYRTLLKAIRTCEAEGKDWRKHIFKFLLAYRNTPHCSTKTSPAMLLMNRPLRDKIPGITHVTEIFQEAKKNDEWRKGKSKKYYDERNRVAQHSVQVGDHVLLKQEKTNKLSTAFGTDPFEVVKVEGPAVTVQRGGQVFIRHAAHLKVIPRIDPVESGVSEDFHPTPYVTSRHTYPTRMRRPPDRYAAHWISTLETLV